MTTNWEDQENFEAEGIPADLGGSEEGDFYGDMPSAEDSLGEAMDLADQGSEESFDLNDALPSPPDEELGQEDNTNEFIDEPELEILEEEVDTSEEESHQFEEEVEEVEHTETSGRGGFLKKLILFVLALAVFALVGLGATLYMASSTPPSRVDEALSAPVAEEEAPRAETAETAELEASLPATGPGPDRLEDLATAIAEISEEKTESEPALEAEAHVAQSGLSEKDLQRLEEAFVTLIAEVERLNSEMVDDLGAQISKIHATTQTMSKQLGKVEERLRSNEKSIAEVKRTADALRKLQQEQLKKQAPAKPVDNGQAKPAAPKTPPATTKTAASSGQPVSKTWFWRALGQEMAVLAGPEEALMTVRPGSWVPGLGRVLALDLEQREVITEEARIVSIKQ